MAGSLSMMGVPRSGLMAVKILAGVLMTITMGLSLGGVFWQRDFDEKAFNKTQHIGRLFIKARVGVGMDVWGSWMSVWALHLLMLSLTIQLDAAERYKFIRWGRFFDIIVLLFTAISALASGILLIAFVNKECSKEEALQLVDDFENDPNPDITTAGANYTLSFVKEGYLPTERRVKHREAVVDAIVEYCVSGINSDLLFATGAMEIASAILTLGIIFMALEVKDEPISKNGKEEVCVLKEASASAGGGDQENEILPEEKSQGDGASITTEATLDESLGGTSTIDSFGQS